MLQFMQWACWIIFAKTDGEINNIIYIVDKYLVF